MLLIVISYIIICPSQGKSSESCYELGYRFGLCSTKSLYGIPCKPENDIVIPENCRGKAEANRGIKAGVKAVYDTLNLATEGSKSSGSIDMLNTSLDVLRAKLEGKTKKEVKGLAGKPDRIKNIAGYECWIYGKSYTTKDRCVMFEGDRVFTVSFY